MNRHFIRSLLSCKKEMSKKEIQTRLKACTLDYLCPPFLVATIELHFFSDYYSNIDRSLEEIQKLLDDFLDKAFITITDFDDIQILFYDCIETPDFVKIRNRIVNYTKQDCFIGIGSFVNDFDKISLSATESQKMLGYRNQYVEKGFAWAEHFVDFRYFSVFDVNVYINQILDEFLAGNLFEMFKQIDEMISFIRNQPSISQNSIRRTLVDLSIRIVNVAAYSKIDVDAVIGKMDIYHWIMEQHHTEIITDWIKKISTTFIEMLRKNNSSPQNKLVANACIYIDKHLDSLELSLQTVSEFVGLTAGYFSVLFKSVMGEGIKAYIVTRRIQRSMYLLEKTNLKIADIAIQTGHSNVQYFSKTFRSHVGVPPNLYRLNKQRKKMEE